MGERIRENKRAGRSIKRLGAAGLSAVLLLGAGLQADAAALKDIFDEKYYADTYEDLKAAYGYDREALWEHFVIFGLKEGRNMNGLLDIVSYREEYADLEAAFGDNWDAYLEHFLIFGAKEGRDTGTDFDALDYAERYEDLKAAFGEDVLALWQHYRDYGASEGREARDEDIVITERLAAEAARRAAEEAMKRKEPQEILLNDGTRLIEEFNELGEKVKITAYNSDGSLRSVQTFEYDDAGNKKEIYALPTGEKSISEYNAAGKLMKVTYYKADGTIEYYDTYEYGGTGYTETRYDAQDQKKSSCEYNFADRKKITYDAQGNKVKEEAL